MKKLLVIALTAVTILTSLPCKAERKSYWLEGMGIGALAGGAAIGTYIAVASSGSKNNNSGDPDDFKGLGKVMIPVSIVGTMLITAGIGTGIGALIKKKPKVSVTPVVNVSKNGNGSYGVGVNGNF
ncbi:MAG: hypothetical protein ABIE74_11805 [Pseudomonadota bacterium]